MHASDAYYRGGIEALREMGDAQERLLRATRPEPRRGLPRARLRRQRVSDPPRLPRGHPENLPPSPRRRRE
jgi:hypothetical protein